jgi:5'-deoxynucleotidase
MIAHSLAVISNTCFGNNINAERVAVLAIYHDSNETITGDMPTPIKYYNPDIEKAYKELEETSKEKLLSMLPPNLVPEYRNLLFYDESSYEGLLVKAADRICAYVKCLEEEKAGNEEFKKAAVATLRKINDMKMPEVDYFFQHFIPGFKLTLDELN